MQPNFSNVAPLTVKCLAKELLADGHISMKEFSSVDSRQEDMNNSGDKHHAIDHIGLQNWVLDGCKTTYISDGWLCKWLARKAGVNYFDMSRIKSIDKQTLKLFKMPYMQKYSFIPISQDNKKIILGTIEPFISATVLQEIKDVAQKECELSVVEPKYFYKVFSLLSNSHRDEQIKLNRKNPQALKIGEKRFLKEDEDVKGKHDIGGFIDISDAEAGDHWAVKYVNDLLAEAFLRNASDIHLEPQGGSGKVRYRVDSVLHSTEEISEEKYRRTVALLKVAAKMDISEKRMPQDGRLRIKSDLSTDVEIRISTMPCPFGEKMVLRIFDPQLLVLPLDKLGFTAEEKEVWDHMVNSPYGLIVVTGPTGSGKTTTLYSALGALVSDEINISTIEDPIEVIDKRFSQLQVNTSLGLTFPLGIKTLLRQDPDIIMIGEIRDSESADVAIQAALTGHLVFATLHTNDVPSTITRLLDLSVPPYLIKAALVGVVAQRLVRVLCEKCKKSVELPADDWEILTSPIRVNAPDHIYDIVGCEECNHIGYKGRTGIYEILYLVESVKRLITPAADSSGLRKAMINAGMKPLRISGALKIAKGITTIDEIYKVIPPHMELI